MTKSGSFHTCTCCAAQKPVGDFPKAKWTCRPCIAEYQRAYRAENADRKREYQQRYYQANATRLDARNAAWAAANPERAKAGAQRRTQAYRARHPEKIRAYLAAYSRAFPEKVAAKTARKRARSLEALPAWANIDAILAVYGEAAALKQLVGDLDVDHIVPLKSDFVCGLHVHQNLQILDPRENSRKGNRHWPDMWPITKELRCLTKFFVQAQP